MRQLGGHRRIQGGGAQTAFAPLVWPVWGKAESPSEQSTLKEKGGWDCLPKTTLPPQGGHCGRTALKKAMKDRRGVTATRQDPRAQPHTGHR